MSMIKHLSPIFRLLLDWSDYEENQGEHASFSNHAMVSRCFTIEKKRQPMWDIIKTQVVCAFGYQSDDWTHFTSCMCFSYCCFLETRSLSCMGLKTCTQHSEKKWEQLSQLGICSAQKVLWAMNWTQLATLTLEEKIWKTDSDCWKGGYEMKNIMIAECCVHIARSGRITSRSRALLKITSAAEAV